MRNIFAKGCAPNLSQNSFVIKNRKNTVPWKYIIGDLNGERIIETDYWNKFYEKELQKRNQTDFMIKK